jgi:hypothetical protein
LSPAFLDKLRQNSSKLRLPQILSGLTSDPKAASQPRDERLLESLSFRLFGQRFTYDAWILNRLTNEAKCPPTAMYIPACFGGRRARAYVQSTLRSGTSTPGAPALLDSLAQEIAKVPADKWRESMGAAWLDLLSTLTKSYGPGFPLYMQAEPFGDKQLQTYLGSFTELKHDTLLYAKQSYAEMGGEGADERIPPLVRGFVEPNLPFWAKLATLIRNAQSFFEARELFKEGIVRERLREFERCIGFYRQIAEKEIKGTIITGEDYEHLRVQGLGFMAEPLSGQADTNEETGKTALVADIHTDGRAQSILYEGTGRPYLMLALVGNEQNPRLTLGVAFNHYEFSRPLGKRVTDEEWKKWIYSEYSKVPPKNDWYKSLVAK